MSPVPGIRRRHEQGTRRAGPATGTRAHRRKSVSRPEPRSGVGPGVRGPGVGAGVSAAVQTVPAERKVHSLHSYFLRPGNVSKPIVYEVDRIRDGGSFTTRRVVAVQGGVTIFNMQASFHVPEPGFDHQDLMPEVPPPDGLKSEQERLELRTKHWPEPMRSKVLAPRAFELRPTDPNEDPFVTTPRAPKRSLGSAPRDRLPDDELCTRTARLRVRLLFREHGAPAARGELDGSRRACRSQASITSCGSIVLFASTNGCSTISRARPRAVPVDSCTGVFSRKTAGSWHRLRKRDSCGSVRPSP